MQPGSPDIQLVTKDKSAQIVVVTAGSSGVWKSRWETIFLLLSMRQMQEFPAVEIVLYIKNGNKKNTWAQD